jgi:REP element-mobilizing transposase RayT
MANTYSQINIHTLFAVQGKENYLLPAFRSDLFKFISGILDNLGQFSLAVNGAKDHVHIFFELNPSDSIADIVKQVKVNSSRWINDNHLTSDKFLWQDGYGVFSYGRSQRSQVIQYFIYQEEYHRRKTFREEYLDFLEKFEIEFEREYLFEFYE